MSEVNEEVWQWANDLEHSLIFQYNRLIDPNEWERAWNEGALFVIEQVREWAKGNSDE
jgi:hypothetical protein